MNIIRNASETVINKDGFTVVIQAYESARNHKVTVNAFAERGGRTIGTAGVNGELGFIGLFFPLRDSNVKDLIEIAVNDSIIDAKKNLSDMAGARLFLQKNSAKVNQVTNVRHFASQR